MADFFKVNIDNKASINSDICVVDRYNNNLIFTSCIGYVSNIKEAVKAINYNTNIYIQSHGTYKTMAFGYNVESRKTADNDFSHFVAYMKDKEFIDSDGDERIACYLFARNDEEKMDIIYDKLYQHLSVPLLKEWIPILYDGFVSMGFIRELEVFHIYDKAPFHAFCLNIKKQNLIDMISAGLKENRLSICDTNQVSATM